MEPERLEVSEVCFHKKVAENRTIQSIHRIENILLNLINIYGQSCSFKSPERIRHSMNESREFFLDWESSQPRPSQKLREVRTSQSDKRTHNKSKDLLIEDTDDSNVPSINGITQPFMSSELLRECAGACDTDVHMAAQVQRAESMSEFDCDLRREMERVKRQRNCAEFSNGNISRFHANFSAQTSTKVSSVKPLNATTNDVSLSEHVVNKSTTQAKKRSAMSVKERLMMESGKILKIPKREVKPYANKAKLDDWLARNKRQSIKRKLNDDQSEHQMHINSKRVKLTQSDTEQTCVQLQPSLTTPLNSKRAAKKSSIPRPIHSVNANPIKQSSIVAGKHTNARNVHMSHSRGIKHLSVLHTEANVHRSLTPRLVKPVNKQTADNRVINGNTKPTLLHRKTAAVTSHGHAPTHSVTHASYNHIKPNNRVKPIYTHEAGSVKPASTKNIQTVSSSGKYTSSKVNNTSRVTIVKPTPCKSSKHTLVKIIK